MNMYENRLGMRNTNNQGLNMVICEYIKANDIYVEFLEFPCKLHTTFDCFISGRIKNPMFPSIYNKGYYGIGKYSSTKDNIAFSKWKSMLKRCYDPIYLNKNQSYIDCYVCDEWLNFQNFAKWFYENYYEINSERIELDKDISIKGNKIYSPNACIFVPQKINALFRSRKSNTIYNGVSKVNMEYNSKYKPSLLYTNSFRYFDNIGEAYKLYKHRKELVIHSLAYEYKLNYPNEFPNKVYNVLMNYSI